MKTLIIFNLVPEEVKYFVTDQDVSDLHDTYINHSDDLEKVERLNELMYDKNGGYLIEPIELVDIDMIEITNAIEVGFIL